MLVVFALSNRQGTRFEFWPTDYTLNAPLGIAVLVVAGIAFLIGSLLGWLGSLAHRMRARRAEARVRLLDAQVAALQGEVAGLSPGAGYPRAGLTGAGLTGAGLMTSPGSPGTALAAPGAARSGLPPLDA